MFNVDDAPPGPERGSGWRIHLYYVCGWQNLLWKEVPPAQSSTHSLWRFPQPLFCLGVKFLPILFPTSFLSNFNIMILNFESTNHKLAWVPKPKVVLFLVHHIKYALLLCQSLDTWWIFKQMGQLQWINTQQDIAPQLKRNCPYLRKTCNHISGSFFFCWKLIILSSFSHYFLFIFL